MKFLLINAVDKIGSTGTNCKEMQEYINNNTNHICYNAFACGNKNEFSFIIGNWIDRKVHSLMSRTTGKQAFFSKQSTKKLIAEISNLKPEIVILNNLHSNYINLPLLLKYLANKDIATIVVLHDCWFFTAKCTHYTLDRCFKWQTGCGNCPRLKEDNPSWFFDRTSYLWKEKKALFESIPRLGVVGVSNWITTQAEKSYLKCAKKISTIYNWIDSECFNIQKPQQRQAFINKMGLQNKKIVLGVSSVLNKNKGIYSLISLAQMLSKDYVMILIGKLKLDVVLPENIIHLDTIEHNETVSYYNMANVFLNASLQESFGKVSAEALSCGTPVVCFDSTSNKELVEEGCGEVVPVGDMHQMVIAIEKICMKDKKFYQEKCRNFAVRKFSLKDRVEQYISFAEELNGINKH